MLTVTPEQLRDAYGQLHPNENAPKWRDSIAIFDNWLWEYEQNPLSVLTTRDWNGKVTKALFKALGIQQPRTKRGMLDALMKEAE